MAEIIVRAPHLTDVGALVARMRKADVDECLAAGVTDIRRAVEDSITYSVWARAALVDEELACIFGVAPAGGRLLSDTGIPWLLGTDVLLRHRGAFMRRAPEYIAAMLSQFKRLENHVHARNVKAVAWLKRSGFALADAKPVAATGELFHDFVMERQDV